MQEDVPKAGPNSPPGAAELSETSAPAGAGGDASLDQVRLKLALEATGLGIWDWDLLTNTMTWSERAKAIYGFAPGQPVTFAAVRAATHPDDLPHTSELSRRARDPQIRGRDPYEYRIIRADNGEIRWIAAHGEAVFASVDGDVRAIRYTGTIQDVTESKRAEEELRASHARLQLAVDAARIAVWDYDGGTDSITGSPELYRMLGFAEGGTPSLDEIRDRYHPEDRDRLRGAGLAAMQGGERYFQTEFRYLWPGGDVRWLLLRAELLAGQDGSLSRALGVLIDITDQKRTEAALRESEERLRLAVRAHRIGIFDWHVPTGKVVWSAQEQRLFGLEPGSFEGTVEGWRSRVLPDDRERMEATIRTAMARGDEELDLEFRIRRPEGAVRHIEGSARFLYGADGAPERMVGVNIDVTDRRRAEEEQKMLISELNHRVKNTLAVVHGIAAQTLQRAGDAAAREAFVGRLRALADAHDVLTRRSWAGAHLAEVVEAALRPHASGEAGRIRIDGPDVLVAPQSAVALTMLLHELATNAIKYGSLSVPGGTVALLWTKAQDGDEAALTLVWLEAGGPPVRKPTRKGFGSRLIERGWAASADTEVTLNYRPEGLVCTLLSRRPAEPSGREW